MNKGYNLKMSGARVGELLSRQFIVPTLDIAPTSSTLSWQDGGYTVNFRIGELCRARDGESWKFYRLCDIVDDKAIWEKANASELPDMSDYYTKDEVDDKISKIDASDVDLSNYYTKEETDVQIEEQIDDRINSITFPEDESIKNVTQEEYDSMLESDSLSDKTLYFVSKDGSPSALYIGKVQIAVREEGSKGFAYNFPIIF